MARRGRPSKVGKQKEQPIAQLRVVAQKRGLTVEALFDAIAMGVQSNLIPGLPAIGEDSDVVNGVDTPESSANWKSWADDAEQLETLDGDPIVEAVER